MGASSNKSSVVEATSPEKPESGHEVPTTSKMGGTENDEHEMRMLGKTQQLNVSRDVICSIVTQGASVDADQMRRETFASSRLWGLLVR